MSFSETGIKKQAFVALKNDVIEKTWDTKAAVNRVRSFEITLDEVMLGKVVNVEQNNGRAMFPEATVNAARANSVEREFTANYKVNTAERTLGNIQQQNNQKQREIVDGFEIND